MSQAEGTQPGRTPRSKVGSIRIGSVLLVIALMALGVGVFRANVLVGGLLIASAAGALVAVLLGAGRRKAEGRPMDLNEGVRAFAFSLGNFFMVLVSAAIAFFATCFPIGLITAKGEEGGWSMVAVAVGGIAALAVGAFVAYRLYKHQRGPKAKEGETEV